eukprot:GSMAST32.ASY1.ANO1.578.1 assembled CDS
MLKISLWSTLHTSSPSPQVKILKRLSGLIRDLIILYNLFSCSPRIKYHNTSRYSMPKTLRRYSKRRATHAGSWYSDDPEYLVAQMQGWIAAANADLTQAHQGSPVRAIIDVKRVFLLGPSHKFYSDKCLLSMADLYETPLGDIPVDKEIRDELMTTGLFDYMDRRVDEDEHSLELHLPYIVLSMKKQPFKLVPIMVGSTSTELESMYGHILAKYLDDPSNIFIISSDFCHWGSRFDFQWSDRSLGPIYKSIEWLDKRGMELIYTSVGFDIIFVKYAQSNQCLCDQDTSVSYASAVVTGKYQCIPISK